MLIGPTRELTVHDIDFVCNYHGKKAEFYKHVWNNKVPVAQMQILLMTTFQRTMKQMDNLQGKRTSRERIMHLMPTITNGYACYGSL